jgi:hypothetical protein
MLTGVAAGNLNRYLSAQGLRPYLDPKQIINQTVSFLIPGTQFEGTGYEATLLIEICDAYLKARDDNQLKENQLPIAKQAEIIIRACAKVGIIALIDEATGYQEVRQKQALQIKLQAFIADELQEWARMFPEEFWLELARLENVRYSARSRPLRWGKYVMAFVYDAMDKDVGQKLRRINPNPRHRRNHHQWLKEFGRTKLNNHIYQVIGVMKVCRNLGEFKTQFAHVFKKVDAGQLSFEDAFASEE